MSAHAKQGFTIIEVLLVLSITGLLVGGLLVAVSGSINNERYRDATETFKSVLQNQYGELASIYNDRENTWSCNSSTTIEEKGVTTENRGQSDCFLLGKLVSINKKTITVSSIVGYEVSPPVEGEDDVTSIKSHYRLNDSPISVDSLKMEWGTGIAAATIDGANTDPTNVKVSILFLRSPTSGQTYTFTTNKIYTDPSPANLKAMIVAGDVAPGTQAERVMCITSEGLAVGGDSALVINKFATGPSAIELMSNSLLLSTRGKDVQC